MPGALLCQSHLSRRLKCKTWGSASTRPSSSQDNLEEQPPSCKENVLQCSAAFVVSASFSYLRPAVICGQSSDSNEHPRQPALPHAALVGIATENGEHCSQSFRCGLTSHVTFLARAHCIVLLHRHSASFGLQPLEFIITFSPDGFGVPLTLPEANSMQKQGPRPSPSTTAMLRARSWNWRLGCLM